MKKVLFVASVTTHINAFHIPYLKLFKEEGYEVHVASFGEENIEYCDKHFNLNFARNPFKLQNLKVYKELKKIIEKENYEIIHCHTPTASVLARIAAKGARKKGTKVIYTAHGFHFYKGAPILNWLIYYPIEKWMSKYTDTLITINEEDYNLAKNKFKKTKNIEYVHGVGLDTARFDIEVPDEQLEDLRKEMGIPKDSNVLTYVAELNKNKNQILLIKTVQELKKEKNNNYTLLLVGDGILKDYYQEYIINNNLQDNVKLLGKRKDIPQILKITDIYVASSLREGLGLNIIEAMYMELLVIATNNRGHRELIVNNENGFLVENVEEMKEKIEKLQNNENMYVKFTKNCKQKAEQFKVNEVIVKMRRIYEMESNINGK